MTALQALRIIRTLANIFSNLQGTAHSTTDIRHRNIFIRILNILQEENINEN